MFKIYQREDGKWEVISRRDHTWIAFDTLEEATKEAQRKEQQLYYGSGVYGNEI